MMGILHVCVCVCVCVCDIWKTRVVYLEKGFADLTAFETLANLS